MINTLDNELFSFASDNSLRCSSIFERDTSARRLKDQWLFLVSKMLKGVARNKEQSGEQWEINSTTIRTSRE